MKKQIAFFFFLTSLSMICMTGCGKEPATPGATPTAITSQPPTIKPTESPKATNTPVAVPDITATPTPTLLPEKLEISEVMANNKSFPINGTLCDWIELYNAGDTDIRLSNFYLSDKEKKPLKSQLPDTILKPGEYIVLTCESEVSLPESEEKVTLQGALSFKLSSEGETIILTRADGLTIDSLSYENLENNYTALKSGACGLPSPGFPNTPEGNKQAVAKVNASAAEAETPGLLINEILSSNNKYNKYKAANNTTDYYDLIELYNASSEPICLSDYYLSDGAKHLLDYRLPDVTLEPGKYLIIYCLGRAAANYDNPTGIFTVPESPIELSYDGETVYLTYKDGLIKDCVTFPRMYDGVSYGRSPEENSLFVIQETPSPGKKNQAGASDFSETPLVNLASGAYKGSISVEFVSTGSIYYTTDNSAPGLSSKLWDGTPLTFDKTTTLRAICYEEGKPKSFEATYNYFIDDYDFTLDVVSVSMSASDWQALQQTTSKAGNYAINIALYKNSRTGDSLILEEEFSLTAVLELAGATTTKMDKQSYQVKFKSAYGPSKLKYKLFADSDLAEFNSFTLRSGSQNNYRALVRDELISSLLYTYYDEELILHESYRPVNLYVNNEYRGVYYIREHLDRDMIASHYGVDPEDVVFSKGLSTRGGNFKGGSEKDKSEMSHIVDLIKKGDFSDPKTLEELCSLVDYESLLVYYATELWSADNDCHIRVYKIGDGKWKFALHDHDLSLDGSTSYVFSNKFYPKVTSEVINGEVVYYKNGEAVTLKLFQILFSNLIKSDQFRSDVLAKLSEYTKTAYKGEYAAAYAKEKLIDVIYHDMEYNCQIWGGKYLYPKISTSSGVKHFTYSQWQTNANNLLNRLNRQKADLITALKASLALTAEEEKLYFGEN